MKLGAVDADEHGSFAGRFGIQGFPTIKIFGGDKSKPTDYKAARFVFYLLHFIATSYLGTGQCN